MVGLLLKVLKKDVASSLMKKAPSMVDIEIQSRLNTKITQSFLIATITIYHHHHHHHLFNHHRLHLFNCQIHLHLEYHLQYLDGFNQHHHLYKRTLISQKQQQQQLNLIKLMLKRNVEESKIQDNLQLQIDDVLSEIPEPPELELSDPLLSILLTESDGFLKTEYINDKNVSETEIENKK